MYGSFTYPCYFTEKFNKDVEAHNNDVSGQVTRLQGEDTIAFTLGLVPVFLSCIF